MSATSLARARAEVHAFLGGALRPPLRQPFGNVVSPSRLRSLRRAGSQLPIPGWRTATDAYAQFVADGDDVSPERLRQELMAEYCRLFVGPGKLRCPPFESVYRDGGTVMGSSTYGVLQCYQEGRFQPAGPREPPDHMASELQFMSHLCRQEGDSWRATSIEG